MFLSHHEPFVSRGFLRTWRILPCMLWLAGLMTGVLAPACHELLAAAPASGDRPNILVILTDDQGWGDLSVNGNTNLRTPHVDSLAKDGASFERFFVCPVCSPTRAEFLTGRYAPRGGVYGTSTGGERLDLDEKTIAESFKAAGYRTGCFGKWHNGSQHPYHPNSRGFDEYYGFTSGHWGEYFNPPLEHNGRPVQGQGFIIDDLTDRVLNFIDSCKNQPFLAYVPYNTPHSPMQVPDRYWNKFKDAPLKLRGEAAKEDNNHTRAALAMCENIDDNVGRILKHLEVRNLASRTIVVYFSDNGPNGARWNGGMKGRKGSTDEGGVRSPLFIRWPGHIRAGTIIPQIAGAIDLLPTLTDLAGVKPVSTKPLDGRSLAPLLLGRSVDWPDRTLFQHWGRKTSARTQQYRLDHEGHLFDMMADPGQNRDISKDLPAVTQRLAQEVAQWQSTVLAELPSKDDRPFPVGGFSLTILPARDGRPHGNIKRSASAPNCSFFTNWTHSAEDQITWDVEVLTAGRYEVILQQTAPLAAVGAEIEVSLLGQTTRAKVAQAFDPPLRGQEQDRVRRGSESYVKDFKPLMLGTLHLPQGRGLLTLKAVIVPYEKVVDVRSLWLERKD